MWLEKTWKADRSSLKAFFNADLWYFRSALYSAAGKGHVEIQYRCRGTGGVVTCSPVRCLFKRRAVSRFPIVHEADYSPWHQSSSSSSSSSCSCSCCSADPEDSLCGDTQHSPACMLASARLHHGLQREKTGFWCGGLLHPGRAGKTGPPSSCRRWCVDRFTARLSLHPVGPGARLKHLKPCVFFVRSVGITECICVACFPCRPSSPLRVSR